MHNIQLTSRSCQSTILRLIDAMHYTSYYFFSTSVVCLSLISESVCQRYFRKIYLTFNNKYKIIFLDILDDQMDVIISYWQSTSYNDENGHVDLYKQNPTQLISRYTMLDDSYCNKNRGISVL